MEIALTYHQTIEDQFPLVDLALSNGDFVIDQGLETLVLVSLLTDRLAHDDDVLPDGSTNRRGAWMDTPYDALTQVQGNLIGSRLWLLTREKQTTQTLNSAISYANEALQWLIDDGIAARVVVTADWGQPTPQLGTLVLRIDIAEIIPGGVVNKQFKVLWDATLALGAT